MKSKNPNEVDLTLGGNNCHSYTIELDNVKNEQVVILSAGCFCDFVDEKNYPFSNEVFDWITSIKNLINKYASKYDVPPIAIAGCLANEYNTRFSKEYTLLKSLFDGMQDSIIPIDGCDPVECLLPKDPNTEQNIAVFELLSGRKIEKKENTVNRKLEEEYQVLKKQILIMNSEDLTNNDFFMLLQVIMVRGIFLCEQHMTCMINIMVNSIKKCQDLIFLDILLRMKVL